MKKSKEKSPEVEQLKTQLARALADYDNLQKRVERQQIELFRASNSLIVKRLLALLDMLDFAQNHLNDAGLAITLKEFRELLKEEGYEEIKPEVGSEFNEEMHEAIEVVDTSEESENNTIAEVNINGWRQIDGPVIRHAKVKVKKVQNKNI